MSNRCSEAQALSNAGSTASTYRTGRSEWLVDEVSKLRTGDSRGLEHNAIDVAPRPILARLNRLHERMVTRVIVLLGMFIFRRIAAANMATGQTHSEMNPIIAGLQTLFAAIRASRDIPSQLKMCARCHQFDLLSFIFPAVLLCDDRARVRYDGLRFPAVCNQLPQVSAVHRPKNLQPRSKLHPACKVYTSTAASNIRRQSGAERLFEHSQSFIRNEERAFLRTARVAP
jgi:hypothetical protein